MSIPKKYLIEKVILIESRIDNLSILRILLQNKQIDTTNSKYNYYKQLADWANSKQEKTGPIDLDKIKLSDRGLITKGKLGKKTNHLGGTLSTLKTLMDQEGKYDSSSALSNLIQKTTLEILASLSGIKDPNPVPPEESEKLENPVEPEDTKESEDPKEPEESTEPDKPAEKITDWTAERAKRLAQTNEPTKVLKQFYNDYYSQEYAGVQSPENDTNNIVSKLKSLDKILIKEFTKLGYNPSVNPLAQFLKILIKLKKDSSRQSKIFDKLTTNTYGAIHNSFINKYITGNMLGNHVADGKGDNLLFCEDLYNYTGLEIVNYLSLQKQVLDKVESKYPGTKNIIAKIFIKQAQFEDDYAANAKKLLEATDVVLVESPTAKLKSVLEVRELFNHLFGTEAKQELTKENIRKIVELSKKNKAMLYLVKYILELVRVRATNPLKIQGYKAITDWLEAQKYEQDEIRYNWCKELLDKYVLDNLTTLLKLATAIIETYNADRHKEKANTNS